MITTIDNENIDVYGHATYGPTHDRVTDYVMTVEWEATLTKGAHKATMLILIESVLATCRLDELYGPMDDVGDFPPSRPFMDDFSGYTFEAKIDDGVTFDIMPVHVTVDDDKKTVTVYFE